MQQYVELDEAIAGFQEYKTNIKFQKRLALVVKTQNSFVNDFPEEKIDSLSLEEYLISKKNGIGSTKSFCYRLRYEMDVLGHMGNVFYNVFGVYVKNGTELALSDSLLNRFGNDYKAAFKYIKKEIKTLLSAFELGDFEKIKQVDLNKSFKYRLLMTYFPDDVFPVISVSTLNIFCDVAGINYIPKDEPIYRNMELVKFKKCTKQLKDWSNFEFMYMLGWMWDNKFFLNKSAKRNITVDNYKNERNKLVQQLAERLNLEYRLLSYENQITLKNDKKRIVCMIRPSKDYFQLMCSKEFNDSVYHSGWRLRYSKRLSNIEDVEAIIIRELLPLFEDVNNKNRTFDHGEKEQAIDVCEPDLIMEAELIDEEISNLGIEGSFKEVVVKQRINQSFFRKQLLKKYNHCCLCNVSSKELLRASHIKPWSVSSSKEKVDDNNGLLLCPNHDALFDQGYISFDDTGKIIVSEMLSEVDRESMDVNEDMFISVNNNNRNYLEYHRSVILKK